MNEKIYKIQEKIGSEVYSCTSTSNILDTYFTTVHKDESIDAMIAMIDEGYTIWGIEQKEDEQTKIEFR